MSSDPLQEDPGLIAVHSACVSMRAIWRPTPCHDMGVDGQIEFLELGEVSLSTGKILAVQVKSGPSYFKEQSETHINYYPSRKHRRYWRCLNLPMVLVLHDPEAGRTVYAEVKGQLESDGPILVPKENVLNASARDGLLALCDRLDDPRRFLSRLKRVTLPIEAGKRISGIEFLLSCLAPSHGYFELRMARFLAMLELAVECEAIGIGSDTYDFIQRSVLLCMGAEITGPFAEIYELQWYDLKLVPDITVPLTPFGALVAQHLVDNADQYVTTNAFAHRQLGTARDVALAIERICQDESDDVDSKETIYDYPR